MKNKDKFNIANIKYTEPTLKKESEVTEENKPKEHSGTTVAKTDSVTEEVASADISTKENPRNSNEPLFRQNFNQSNKRQLGFRTRAEFLEALKLEGKGSNTSGEAILDRILIEYYSNNPDKTEYLQTARQMIKLSQKFT